MLRRGPAPFAQCFFTEGASSMAGKVKQLIDHLIQLRTKGDAGLVAPVKIKLIMKGIDPDLFAADSPDDPAIIQKITAIAKEMGYKI